MSELDGTPEQLKKLLRHFDANLSPNDKFWKSLSETVKNAYPDGLKGIRYREAG